MALAKIANPLMKRAMDFKETEEDSDTETKTEKVSVAHYRNLEVDVAAADAQKSGLQPVVIGNGKKVQKQSTANGDQLISGEKLILYTGGDKLMPDVTGWSKADIMKLGKSSVLKLVLMEMVIVSNKNLLHMKKSLKTNLVLL